MSTTPHNQTIVMGIILHGNMRVPESPPLENMAAALEAAANLTEVDECLKEVRALVPDMNFKLTKFGEDLPWVLSYDMPMLEHLDISLIMVPGTDKDPLHLASLMVSNAAFTGQATEPSFLYASSRQIRKYVLPNSPKALILTKDAVTNAVAPGFKRFFAFLQNAHDAGSLKLNEETYTDIQLLKHLLNHF